MHLEKKDIVNVLLLTLVTCGIYSFVWMYQVAEAMSQDRPNDGFQSGPMTVLLTLITCGLYSFYFMYILGNSLATFDPKGTPNDGILYMLLNFCLGIVGILIAQDRINKIVDHFNSNIVDVSPDDVSVK